MKPSGLAHFGCGRASFSIKADRREGGFQLHSWNLGFLLSFLPCLLLVFFLFDLRGKIKLPFLRFRKSGNKKKGQNNVASFKVGFSSLLLPEESLDPKNERKCKEQDRSLVRAAFPAANACLKVTSYPDPNTPTDGTNSELLPGKTRRSKTLLTLDEENKLANHLIELRKQG